MNPMISVSSTLISGVTLISGPRAPPPAMENDIESSSLGRACLQQQTPATASEFPRSVLARSSRDQVKDREGELVPELCDGFGCRRKPRRPNRIKCPCPNSPP